MLRGAVVVLVLANALLAVYAQGGLAALGWEPVDTREAYRMAQQVQPQALKVVNATAPIPPTQQSVPMAAASADDDVAPFGPPAAPAASPVLRPVPAPSTPIAVVARPRSCWQAIGIGAAQQVLVSAALNNMGDLAGKWTLTDAVQNARWLVYMGPFATEGALEQQKRLFRQAGIDHRVVSLPKQPWGLVLGTYSTVDGAQRVSAELNAGGWANVSVVQERPDIAFYVLRLESISAAQKRRIEDTGILRGRILRACS